MLFLITKKPRMARAFLRSMHVVCSFIPQCLRLVHVRDEMVAEKCHLLGVVRVHFLGHQTALAHGLDQVLLFVLRSILGGLL